MRQMYFLVFIFSFYCGNAQFQFSLPSIEDSCIYLSDCFFYFEKDIHRTKNNPPETEVSIYDRKETELLQVEKITKLNLENRLLSVFQEGTFNSLEYNYGDYTGMNSVIAPGLIDSLMKKPRGNFHILTDYGDGFTSYYSGNNFEIDREYNLISQVFMPTGKYNGYMNCKRSKRRFQQGNTQTFEFKNQQKSEFPLLKLQVTFNDLYTRSLLLGFREDSSKDDDWPMDAQISKVLDNDIGWNINDILYNIQVRPFRKNDKIPLYIKLTEANKLHFHLNDSRYFEKKDIYLFDAELDIYKQLDENNFSIDLQKGNYSKRFFLSFIKEKKEKPHSEVLEE